jgi:hypothetical protein
MADHGHVPGGAPIPGRYYEECERQTRRALGEQAFRAAYQRGMELALA